MLKELAAFAQSPEEEEASRELLDWADKWRDKLTEGALAGMLAGSSVLEAQRDGQYTINTYFQTLRGIWRTTEAALKEIGSMPARTSPGGQG